MLLLMPSIKQLKDIPVSIRWQSFLPRWNNSPSVGFLMKNGDLKSSVLKAIEPANVLWVQNLFANGYGRVNIVIKLLIRLIRRSTTCWSMTDAEENGHPGKIAEGLYTPGSDWETTQDYHIACSMWWNWSRLGKYHKGLTGYDRHGNLAYKIA